VLPGLVVSVPWKFEITQMAKAQFLLLYRQMSTVQRRIWECLGLVGMFGYLFRISI